MTGDEIDDFLCFCRIDVFVIVAGEECTTICRPEILENSTNRCGTRGRGFRVDCCDDIQPCYNRPQTVFLSDMI